MGREVTCQARIDGQLRSGKALLETAEILFRGIDKAPPLRIPFAQIRQLSANDGSLTVRWAGGQAVFTLGVEAEKWADRIKNPPSRLDKLGVKSGMTVAVVGTLEESVLAELASRANLHVRAGKPRTGQVVDMVFLAVESRADLGQLAALASVIVPDGAIWVIRRKGKQASVTEAQSMAAGKAAGLVDTKVVGLSPTHTAERYVIPVARRPKAASRG